MDKSLSSQSMLDDYWGPLKFETSFTPWKVRARQDTHINDYFPPRTMEIEEPATPITATRFKTHESDEESLLHDDIGIQDLLGDDQPMPERDIPSFNLKHTFKTFLEDETMEM